MASSVGNPEAESQAKQGVQECVSMSWYSFDADHFTLEEWAEMQAVALWDARDFFDKHHDLEGGIVIENYKSWALEKAQELNEEV